MLKQAQPTLVTISNPKRLIGSLGHLSIFLWALGMVLLPPLKSGVVPALLALTALGILYPFAIHRLARPRWLFILCGLFLVNVFFGIPKEGTDWMVLGLPTSSIAIFNGVQMTLRAVVILMAADGLSSSVNITEVAGLLERSGLQGLGFSIGVATNLLPDLRQSSTNAWHSLRMRGGLRANWWRGIQLLLLTVLSNSLRHAEEIVLAAEVRAFRPELSRKVSLRIGTFDWWLVAGEVSMLVVILVL
ncbi:MAG: energy-coupling factor transporter transmembrane protein EcfT [Anaerolineales bacterium]|nr:energy-coupling factor transporter transmembrane protein EcfT [Anaerolineales bacterium]